MREEHLTACLTEPYSAKKVASYLGGQRFDADYVHDDDYSTMKHSKVPQIKWVKSLETTGFRDFCFDQKMMTFGQINLFMELMDLEKHPFLKRLSMHLQRKSVE